MKYTYSFIAMKEVLTQKNYFILFLVISLIFFALFILIPLMTIVGADLKFFLAIFSVFDYIILIILAFLIGITFSLQIFSYREKKVCSAPQSIAQGATTGVAGIFAAILGTAFCASCLVPLFAAIGLGSGAVFFVLGKQLYFVTGAIVLMIISLYFATQKAYTVIEMRKNKS